MQKLLFLLIPLLFCSQSYRFVYEYRIATPWHGKDSTTVNYMNLDSDGSRSVFYNAVKYKNDSIYAENPTTSQHFKAESYNRDLRYVVSKNYKDQNIDFYVKYSNVNLNVKEIPVIKWNVEQKFKTIQEMHCQLATTEYGGRKWEAWFTPYPISDGPYKFSGLPGLIVTLNDTENQHSFNLIEIKKISKINNKILIPKSYKEISVANYRALLKNHNVDLSADAKSFAADVKNNKIMVEMNDGYIGKYNYSELKRKSKSGNVDEEIARRLQFSPNQIER